MRTSQAMQDCIQDLVDDTRGILAADESSGTIAKRFADIQVESTEENRRGYRDALLSASGLGEYISGVILFEETLGQHNAEGAPLPEVAWKQGIVPGIKVDKGLGDLPGAPGDRITFGLDGLAERLEGYKAQGARFAKWREVYPITAHNPTALGLSANAEMLARYAAQCQALGVVPIVEPEVLMDGDHHLARCAEVTEAVLQSVFAALRQHGVVLELMLLKPNMVLPGKSCPVQAGAEEVAEQTLRVLRRSVPAAVPSINFLSGGMGPEEATLNLNALNQQPAPWQLSLSYGRALQQPALHAWRGQPENVDACQQALLKRARLNSLARQGKYRPELEE
ncbi:class I fructose-bisphosphate aldolase [Motiliproteus sp. SC1-56]|uniref:class I fructose-bisphosphate aldolase n=1 Tax=Motiliproteus sp. SC1-56 TaxID=2799565 RepID=UPI001A8EC4C4|nr:class I fructose-bisphosphate aldolase [Motiliproteus sp. SC1-56]